MKEFLKQTYNNCDKRWVYIWSTLLVITISLEIAATIVIPGWRTYFFNEVELKNMNGFLIGLGYFGVLSITFAIAQGFKVFIEKRLSLVLRKSVIKVLKKKWFTNIHSNLDNPEQRIAEDSRSMTEYLLEVSTEIVISAVIVVGLIISMIHSHSVLLIGSLVYTLVAGLIASRFYRPMIDRDKCLQRQEAVFRYGLSEIRMDNTPKWVSFKPIIQSYKKYISLLFGYQVFNRAQSNLTPIIPYIILIPLFFSGSITLGDVMGGVAKFELMIVNATILLQLYPQWTRTVASFERIIDFFSKSENN